MLTNVDAPIGPLQWFGFVGDASNVFIDDRLTLTCFHTQIEHLIVVQLHFIIELIQSNPSLIVDWIDPYF